MVIRPSVQIVRKAGCGKIARRIYEARLNVLVLFFFSRNAIYNISLHDLAEIVDQRLQWSSSGAHRELCYLKGRSEDECQNYVRVFGRQGPDRFLVCGTNAYKPLCRQFTIKVCIANSYNFIKPGIIWGKCFTMNITVNDFFIKPKWFGIHLICLAKKKSTYDYN
ncbi:semaphorin-1A-like isoform X2 [Hylaeus volcanicus]|uniref:semaphorin-1A-like isoform X2 n=1 Tax=Hylaeus volcanicus TaxID=313075 RepID=UPI0023B7EF8F|nr:semaphorin-1A-like isoform X2 [Hylaeus volcanicus]